MKIANIRPPYSVRYGLVIAVSMMTLSGCVSAVTDDQETAATITEQGAPANTAGEGVPSPASGSAAKSAAGYVDPSMVSAAAPTGGQAEQSADASSPQVYGSAPAIAGLVTQPTAISAGTSSIYSSGSQPVAVQPQVAEGEAVSTPIPAYVPVPVINPALNSVYSAPPQVPQQAQQPQNTVVPQEQSAVLPTTAPQPAPADTQTKNDTGGSSDKQAVSLAAFFAGAAKIRAARPATNPPATSQQVASLPRTATTDDLQTGIALNGRATMSDEFDDAHIDEDEEPVGLMKLASLSGLSRIAPNGLFLQTDHVNVGCFKPDLVNLIKDIETYYHRPAIITSGYRPPRNVRQGSKHYTCEAADIQIEGVSKWELATYLRSRPNRGGVGTYCHTESVHVDTGEARDWNWRCRRTVKKS